MSSSSICSFEYLEGLPGTVFRRLYEQPSTALAIFRRMLPHLGKTMVMAMLYISQPLPLSNLDSWVRPEAKAEKMNAIALLERLYIIKSHAVAGKSRAYVLTNPFAKSLRLALTGGGSHRSFGVACSTPNENPLSVAQLDDYARQQWEAVLGFMVGSTGVNVANDGIRIGDNVKELLAEGGLVTIRGRNATITESGFAFILQETNEQVWTVLIYYLRTAEKIQMDDVEVLSFLFLLGSLELGEDYSKASLTPTQYRILDDLTHFGIIYQSSASSSRFYPTRLATTLTSDASALRNSSAMPGTSLSSSDGQGYIVIETNYRFYAYTSSNLQIAILQLFAKISTRYPNMVAGKITRESTRRAVAMGITSEQIISYLTTHAHPQMRKDSPILPPTVVDQIRLWQIESERMKTTPGFLFKEFATTTDYKACCQFADEVGVLVWKSDPQLMFFVTRHEQVAVFLKSRQKKAP